MTNDLHSIIERQEYTQSYFIRYVAEIMHLGLGKSRVIKDLDFHILHNKINAQFKIWDDQFEAIESTSEAQDTIVELENILICTPNNTFNFEKLKDKTIFHEVNPKTFLDEAISNIIQPSRESDAKLKKPEQPKQSDFYPQLSFFDSIIPSLKRKKMKDANYKFKNVMAEWEKQCIEIDKICEEIDADFRITTEEYNSQIEEIKRKYDDLEAVWRKNEKDFYVRQNQENQKIDELEQRYLSKEEEVILY